MNFRFIKKIQIMITYVAINELVVKFNNISKMVIQTRLLLFGLLLNLAFAVSTVTVTILLSNETPTHIALHLASSVADIP